MGKKPGRGRPRLSEKGKGPSDRVSVRYNAELLSRLDKWRKAQAGKPTRSEASRALTEQALAAAGF